VWLLPFSTIAIFNFTLPLETLLLNGLFSRPRTAKFCEIDSFLIVLGAFTIAYKFKGCMTFLAFLGSKFFPRIFFVDPEAYEAALGERSGALLGEL